MDLHLTFIETIELMKYLGFSEENVRAAIEEIKKVRVIEIWSHLTKGTDWIYYELDTSRLFEYIIINIFN